MYEIDVICILAKCGGPVRPRNFLSETKHSPPWRIYRLNRQDFQKADFWGCENSCFWSMELLLQGSQSSGRRAGKTVPKLLHSKPVSCHLETEILVLLPYQWYIINTSLPQCTHSDRDFSGKLMEWSSPVGGRKPVSTWSQWLLRHSCSTNVRGVDWKQVKRFIKDSNNYLFCQSKC